MNDLMSVGVHRLWKAAMIDWLAPDPACACWMWPAAPATSRFGCWTVWRAVGVALPRIVVCDVNPHMLEIGRDRALDANRLDAIDWLCADAEALPLPDRSVDAYTIAFGIRNVTRIDRALAEARRVLVPGGRFLCLEFATVASPALAAGLRPVLVQRAALARGAGRRRPSAAYRYLVESIRRFPDQATFARMIEEAGLERVRYRDLSGGIAAMHSAWRL